MKSSKYINFITIIVFVLSLNSCIIEEEEEFTFTIKNESSKDITLERMGGYDINFTSLSIQINSKSQFSFHYDYAVNVPFPGTDSIFFINNDLSFKKFGRNTESKNPLRIEYYEGGKVDYKHHISIYKYVYTILDADFLE
jgi:hypothetical protein